MQRALEQQSAGSSKPSRMIVVMAFDRDDEGELRPAFKPVEKLSEASAKFLAAAIAHKHAGVIAWSRSAQPDIGEFGEPEIIYREGQVPEME